MPLVRTSHPLVVRVGVGLAARGAYFVDIAVRWPSAARALLAPDRLVGRVYELGIIWLGAEESTCCHGEHVLHIVVLKRDFWDKR